MTVGAKKGPERVPQVRLYRRLELPIKSLFFVQLSLFNRLGSGRLRLLFSSFVTGRIALCLFRTNQLCILYPELLCFAISTSIYYLLTVLRLHLLKMVWPSSEEDIQILTPNGDEKFKLSLHDALKDYYPLHIMRNETELHMLIANAASKDEIWSRFLENWSEKDKAGVDEKLLMQMRERRERLHVIKLATKDSERLQEEARALFIIADRGHLHKVGHRLRDIGSSWLITSFEAVSAKTFLGVFSKDERLKALATSEGFWNHTETLPFEYDIFIWYCFKDIFDFIQCNHLYNNPTTGEPGVAVSHGRLHEETIYVCRDSSNADDGPRVVPTFTDYKWAWRNYLEIQTWLREEKHDVRQLGHLFHRMYHSKDMERQGVDWQYARCMCRLTFDVSDPKFSFLELTSRRAFETLAAKRGTPTSSLNEAQLEWNKLSGLLETKGTSRNEINKKFYNVLEKMESTVMKLKMQQIRKQNLHN